MPCTGQQGGYNPYTDKSNVKTVYVDNPKDKVIIAELNETVNNYEAALCAIITELEKKGIASEIMNNSSINGFIDIISFWSKHILSDESRINEKLKQFSNHEKSMIKDILNKS